MMRMKECIENDKVFWLFMISGVKVILTKGISVALLLLSIFIKGKINHFDEKQWDMILKI